jgi:hypothetical protein
MTSMVHKRAAWELLGAAYWSSGYRGGPSPRDRATYLAGLEAGCDVAVIGASTRDLVVGAAERGCRIHVIDFSARMCEDLVADVGEVFTYTVHDITEPAPATLHERFDVVLADRLLNRFSAPELTAALGTVLALLAPHGELRTAVRVGLYERDLPVLACAWEVGRFDEVFEPSTGHIDYAPVADHLASVLPPHGHIPPELVAEFYRLRGREKRLRAGELETIVTAVANDRSCLAVERSEELVDQPDRLFTVRRRPR